MITSSISPDFVIELRSPSDSPKELREKMQKYIDNGVQSTWGKRSHSSSTLGKTKFMVTDQFYLGY